MRTAMMYQGESAKAQETCKFCGRVLGTGFNFTCHVCGATYCYTHRPEKCEHQGMAMTPLGLFSAKRS